MTDRRPRVRSRATLNVLFVCTANICRSPLAALYLSKLLEDASARGGPSDVGIEVSSRGVLARPGYHIDPVMAEYAQNLGIRYGVNEHVTAALTADDLERADLVVCMEHRHTPYVTELMPRAVRKTITLRGLGALAQQDMPDDVLALRDPRERAAWLMSTRGFVALDPGEGDVPDPYRRSRATYDASVELITSNVRAIASALTRVD